MTAIETDGLTKRYGNKTVLSGLDLSVENGEVFGFLGPNGAGKTTTIDILLDFISPTSGSATVFGHDVHEEAQAIRDKVGILPDGYELWDRSTGYRHLEFALDSLDGDEDPDELLERVGLNPEDAKRKVGGYSKGMDQRLSLAMALVGDPDLLIMDEPSSGLDPHGIQRMQHIVREAAADGTTVFFSSHILGQVSSVCDRVGILDDGELVTIDTINGLRQKIGVTSNLILKVDGAADANLSAIDGVTKVRREGGPLRVSYTDPRAKATVVHRLVESNTKVLDFAVEEPTLEDIFSAFTESGVDRDSRTRSEFAPTADGQSAVEANASEGPR